MILFEARRPNLSTGQLGRLASVVFIPGPGDYALLELTVSYQKLMLSLRGQLHVVVSTRVVVSELWFRKNLTFQRISRLCFMAAGDAAKQQI